jgi:hypothetical protein
MDLRVRTGGALSLLEGHLAFSEGEKRELFCLFSSDGRKEWARSHATFALIWADFAEFRGNLGDREKQKRGGDKGPQGKAASAVPERCDGRFGAGRRSGRLQILS